MLQINKIIRQLWCATYKGNDIDYIEIKTDDGETLGGADKRKVVNYRVVMVKKSSSSAGFLFKVSSIVYG